MPSGLTHIHTPSPHPGSNQVPDLGDPPPLFDPTTPKLGAEWDTANIRAPSAPHCPSSLTVSTPARTYLNLRTGQWPEAQAGPSHWAQAAGTSEGDRGRDEGLSQCRHLHTPMSPPRIPTVPASGPYSDPQLLQTGLNPVGQGMGWGLP